MRRLLSSSASALAPAGASAIRRSRTFVDAITLRITAGSGGNGGMSYAPRTGGKRSPDGGHGGRGGDVVIRTNASVRHLARSSYHVKGHHGGHGARNGMTGRGGLDRVIQVPVGTCVYEAPPTRRVIADEFEGRAPELRPIADLCADGAEVVVAKGGQAGKGNILQVSQSFRFYEPLGADVRQGKSGEQISVLLKLKSIADVGLVGFPNAGKSSLLGAISLAKPKVAAYPFTTLQPHIGMVEFSDYFRVSVADLPGLIDGASENRGLGHRFLQHVERTKVLVLVVDVAPAQEGRERAAGEDLQALLRELDLYDPGLSSRPSIVVANKMDSRFAARGLESLRRAAPESAQGRVIPVSALTGVGVPEFVRALRLLVEGQPPRASREAAA